LPTGSKSSLYKAVLVLIDLILINGGYLLAYLIRYGYPLPSINSANFEAYLASWPWLNLSALGLLYFYRFYAGYRWRWAEIFAGILCVVFFQTLAAIAIVFYMRGFAFPRTVLLLAPFVHLVLLSAWRRLAWHIERGVQGTRRALVVGRHAEAVALAEKLKAVSFGMIRVDGLVVDRLEGESNGDNHPVLGEISVFCECLDADQPDAVFVCAGLSMQDKAEVLYTCAARDVGAYLVPGFYEILVAQSRLDQVDDIPVFAVGRLSIPEEARLLKRVLDIAFSLFALVLAAPLMALVAAAVRLDSPGPVLYRQRRLSEHGKPFYLYKFRTMVDGAEAATGPVLAGADDPRVTRVGRVLRATRLDELPQLINVLRGEMSLVGPRPERPFFVNQLMSEVPEYVYRMNVKSGITGLAQVAGRYSTSPECKLMYDLLYTRSYSPARDIAILFQTVKVILMKDRAS
jgi:exopolysaccharide biosynthesis polyprenyl glycosylphosphotransferase